MTAAPPPNCYPHVAWLRSPLGRLRLESDGDALRILHFDTESRPHAGSADAIIEQAAIQLHEYFSGSRQAFDLPLAFAGTAFQEQVWRALLTIPFGTTASYGDIAARIGQPGAARAVGLANNRNPIAIIMPCHRIIGANGDLVGYGGGLAAKDWLLRHEGFVLPQQITLL